MKEAPLAHDGLPTDSQSRGYVSATRGRILEGAQLAVICFALSRIFAIRKINPDMDDGSGRSGIFSYFFRIFLSGMFVINRAFPKARAPAFSRNFRKSIDK